MLTFDRNFASMNIVNVAQTSGVRKFLIQNIVSAAESDIDGVMNKQAGIMHDSLSCGNCTLHVRNSFGSHRKVISGVPEVADFYVERVMNEQEIHDLCCYSCNSYITKRVILPRKDITPHEEAISFGRGQMIVPMPEVIESSIPQVSGLDLVKAVVYGGLLQSITGLSVVVSAAGGGASTLNIVALALANVFGGLLVLAHSLKGLKQVQNTEHYEQQLGRPGHFLFHATTAIISYLVFGLMSPIVYGFSFYKSDNKYPKLATLAAASLVCITLLSAGKAYVQRPPKPYLKTIFSYISLGIMVSGPGYVVGDLANMLLKKLAVFDSMSSGSMYASY